MKTRVVVLGAGFGGLELTTMLSDAFGDAIDIVLIDKGDAFVFGFSKLDVMFGRQLPAAVRHPYRDIVKPGVRFLQTMVRSIDPAARRAVTDAGTFDADVLVVALGADYDLAATPGLVEGGNEFYSVAGAFALRDVLPRFERGPAIVGVCGKSFKCPPAPSETALLLHDYLTARGRREATEISVVMPFGTPIPPSPDTSQAILAAFAERGITFVKDSLVKALDPARKVAVLSDGTEMPYELFLGIPVHRVPQVVVESGLAAHPHDWVPVNKQTLETKFPGVYAVGDVNGVGTPKAGVFAEGSAQVVAAAIIAQLRGGPSPEAYKGQGSCYVEFGHGQVGRVDVDFLSGPKPSGHVPGAFGGAGRRESALRIEPASALVRTPASNAGLNRAVIEAFASTDFVVRQLPRPAGPNTLEVRGQGNTQFDDGREAPVGIGVDSGEQNLLELRIDLGILVDTPADVGGPRPFIAGEHRVEHRAQREQIRSRIGRLTGQLWRRVSGSGRRIIEDPSRVPGGLVRRFEVDNPDHRLAAFPPAEDVHGIEIDVPDLQTMKLGQRLGNLDHRSEMGDLPGGDSFRADGRRQWPLVKERHGQIDAVVAQASVFPQHWKVLRVRQLSVDGRKAGDFVREILLVDKARLRGHFDQHVRPTPLVASDVELMAAMFPGRMPAAGGREPMDAPELIEGRGLAVDIDRGAVGHDGPLLPEQGGERQARDLAEAELSPTRCARV